MMTMKMNGYNSDCAEGRSAPEPKPIVHVYAMRIPFEVESDKILPPERAREIESCSNEKVRREKFYVWKLLETGLMRSLGLSMDEAAFTQTASGKWESPYCYVSLAHSGDIVAVAISGEPVGVDVERVDEQRFTTALAERILTKGELRAFEGVEKDRPAALAALWTRKEALFKCTGGGGFVPRNVETGKGAFAMRELFCGGKRYLLTAFSPHAGHADFFLGEGLDEINI